MNIFFLDEDMIKSAEYHVDKHVVKMRLELAQLACTAHWMTGGSAPYKKTHFNHPSAIWTRESLSNYIYVVKLGLALCKELDHRYGIKDQKVQHVLMWCMINKPNIPDLGLTRPKLAIDNKFRLYNLPKPRQSDMKWAVENYRNYYNHGKMHLFKWKNRSIPKWINIQKPSTTIE